MTHLVFLFLISVLVAIVVIHGAKIFALKFDITDQPGGHKQHDSSTPFVGGAGILAVLLLSLIIISNNHPDQGMKWLVMGMSSIIMFITGFVDDLIRLSPKIRLLIQSMVALIMVLVGSVVLNTLGMLFSDTFEVSLGHLKIPFTVFAALGVINALNMVDGIDGLSGVVSLISLVLIGFLALIAGNSASLTLIVMLAGGVIGFLYFNLRYPSQRRARVFMGDNGSMLLGFIIAWLLIDLSQGSSPAMTPVTALWLFSVPLMDTVSVMLRRVRLNRSPLSADTNHFHHILLNSGFRVEDAVFVIGSLQLLLGTIGTAGLLLQLSESIMFAGFLLVFLAYYYLTSRPWYFMSLLRHFHTLLGLAPVKYQNLFLGDHSAKEAEELVGKVCKLLGYNLDSWVNVLERRLPDNTLRYAVIVNICLTDEECIEEQAIKQRILELDKNMMAEHGIQIRQCIERSSYNERRQLKSMSSAERERRFVERRRASQRVFLLEVTQCSVKFQGCKNRIGFE